MTSIGTRGSRAIHKSRFFARTGWLMLAMVVGSFPLTYFSPMVTGARHFAPIYHIHGLAFFAWIGLYAWQAQLIADGRTLRHRELGLAGIALTALMLPLGIALAIAAIRRRMSTGDPHPFDVTLYNMVDIASFSILMIASIAAVTRHSNWHRRFTFAAALCLVGPAISRWILPLPPLPPITDFAPNILADLFLIALIFHDRRTLGRVHPATIWVMAILIPIHLVSPYLASSDAWRAIAPAILQLD